MWSVDICGVHSAAIPVMVKYYSDEARGVTRAFVWKDEWAEVHPGYATDQFVVTRTRPTGARFECQYQANPREVLSAPLGEEPMETGVVLYDACGECTHCQENGISAPIVMVIHDGKVRRPSRVERAADINGM